MNTGVDPANFSYAVAQVCTEVERRGLSCRVTSVERTLVDVLDRPDLAGGLEEVWRSLTSFPMLDLDAVVTYVRLCGQATLAAKVGFFLAQLREALGVPRTLGSPASAR